MWARAAVIVALAASNARADEPRCGLGAYLEPSVMVGGSVRWEGPLGRITSWSGLLQLGGGISERLCSDDRSEVTRLQLGLVFTATTTGTTNYEGSGGVGFEAAADHTIAPDWRLGGEASVAFGNERYLYTVGARLHYRDWAWVGASVLRVQTAYTYDPCAMPTTQVDGCQASASGLYVGLGVEHRYVAYATGPLLVIGGILVAIAAASFHL